MEGKNVVSLEKYYEICRFYFMPVGYGFFVVISYPMKGAETCEQKQTRIQQRDLWCI